MHDAGWAASKENNVQFLHMQKNLFECPSFCMFNIVIMLQPCVLHNYIYKYLYFFQSQRIMSAYFNN